MDTYELINFNHPPIFNVQVLMDFFFFNSPASEWIQWKNSGEKKTQNIDGNIYAYKKIYKKNHQYFVKNFDKKFHSIHKKESGCCSFYPFSIIWWVFHRKKYSYMSIMYNFFNYLMFHFTIILITHTYIH